MAQVDPEIAAAIDRETARQNSEISLVASENYASEAVLAAQGTVLTNKYAEGYPGKRYYGGCENVDYIEALCIQRAKELFGAEHANVQPYSGSQANQAAYFAFLKPGDRYLAMELAHGGHLTHGSPVNFSGIHYQPCYYGVDPKTEMLDYDAIERIACECSPKIIVIGSTVYPRFIDFERFRKIADKAGSLLMADIAHIAGLVAAGEHPSPVPYCDVVTFTTHKTLRGPRAGMILCKQAYAEAIDRAVFPGLQGGPLRARDRSQGRVPQRGHAAGVQGLSEAGQSKCRRARKRTGQGRAAAGERRHGQPPDAARPDPDAHNGQGRAGSPGRHRHCIKKSMIPFDKEKPTVTSGLRLGTAAVTTRGMKEKDMAAVADLIIRCLSHTSDSAEDTGARAKIAKEVRALAEAFPVYGPGIAAI